MTAPEEPPDPEMRLAAEIERLRLRMEAEPPLSDVELRRRVDVIADGFLALYGPGDAGGDLSEGSTRLPLPRGRGPG